MQIHELNNFTGTLGSGAYLAIDDGNDTGKISSQGLLAATEARIDNIIAGPAPSAEEIVDARLGDDGVTYPSLGDAIRDQVGDLKSAVKALFDSANLSSSAIIQGGTDLSGNVTTRSDQIRNKGFITAYKGSSITLAPGTACANIACVRFAMDKSLISDSGWYSAKTTLAFNDEDSLLIFLFKKSDYSAIAPSEYDATVTFRSPTKVLEADMDNTNTYFATGACPAFSVNGTSVTVSDTTHQFRIYKNNKAVFYTDVFGTFTVDNFDKLVLDKKDSSIKVVDMVTSGDYINLLSNSGGSLDGLLAPFYYKRQLDDIKVCIPEIYNKQLRQISFSVGAGQFHSSTKDRLENLNIEAGQKFYYEYDLGKVINSQVFAVYKDGTSEAISSNGTTTKYFNIFTPTKAVDKIGIAIDNTEEATVTACDFYVAKSPFAFEEEVQSYISANKMLCDSTLTEAFSALYNASEKSDTFMFFSDPHLMQSESNLSLKSKLNIEKNLAELKKYADEVKPSTIISGGDWLNYGDTKENACYKMRLAYSLCMRYFYDYNFHFLLGNHDTNYQGIEEEGASANSGTLSQAVLNNLLYADENTKKSYFSYDTANTKYYCFDTETDFDTSMSSYKMEQLEWFANRLTEDVFTNAVVALHIYTVNPSETFGEDDLPFTVGIVDIITAYNNRSSITVNNHQYSFANVSGKIRCILTGHTHYDKIATTTDGLPVVCITDATDYGASPIKFDMGFLDYTNDTLTLIRVNDTDNVGTRTVNLR